MKNPLIELSRSIQKEIEHVQVKKTRGGVDRRLDAREDSDDVLLCYQRIQIYLQRLSVSYMFDFDMTAEDSLFHS